MNDYPDDLAMIDLITKTYPTLRRVVLEHRHAPDGYRTVAAFRVTDEPVADIVEALRRSLRPAQEYRLRCRQEAGGEKREEAVRFRMPPAMEVRSGP